MQIISTTGYTILILGWSLKYTYMIRSIGFRATPHEVYYSIVSKHESDIEIILLIDQLVLPRAMEVPEKLKYLRTTFLDIINEYQVTKACVRATENSANKPDISRVYVEAVIQELIASSTILH